MDYNTAIYMKKKGEVSDFKGAFPGCLARGKSVKKMTIIKTHHFPKG